MISHVVQGILARKKLASEEMNVEENPFAVLDTDELLPPPTENDLESVDTELKESRRELLGKVINRIRAEKYA